MKPVVNKSLDQMNGLQRTEECFRYMVLSVEFWISPEGQLRKWVKINARVALFIGAPTFMVLPVVVAALWELSLCLGVRTSLGAKLTLLPVLLILLSISIVFRIIGVFKR